MTSSDMRWCSDGFEIKCYFGETVTATFTKDCCDRETMAWRARLGKRLPGEPVQKMLIVAVERRFGAVESMPTQRLEFLTDNGGAYIYAETRRIARSLGLEPINTPVCSSQSNGMAPNTFRRDCISRMDPQDARTNGTTASGVRALQRRAPTFKPSNEVAAQVHAGLGETATGSSGATLRIGNVRL